MEANLPIATANPNLPADQPFFRWTSLSAEAMRRSGIDPGPTPTFKQEMEEAGFVNIHLEPIQWPIGPWSKGSREKLIGRLMIENLRSAIKPLIMGLFTNMLGWSVEEGEAFAPLAEKDLTGNVGKYYAHM
jgi:hypothetical protein